MSSVGSTRRSTSRPESGIRHGCLGHFRSSGYRSGHRPRSEPRGSEDHGCPAKPRHPDRARGRPAEPGMTSRRSRSMAGFGSPARSRDVNRTLTSCHDDVFGWSMRPWDSVPATPRGRAADSQDRMDQSIGSRLRAIGCEEVNRTALDHGMTIESSSHPDLILSRGFNRDSGGLDPVIHATVCGRYGAWMLGARPSMKIPGR
jgi:hypothetical protein